MFQFTNTWSPVLQQRTNRPASPSPYFQFHFSLSIPFSRYYFSARIAFLLRGKNFPNPFLLFSEVITTGFSGNVDASSLLFFIEAEWSGSVFEDSKSFFGMYELPGCSVHCSAPSLGWCSPSLMGCSGFSESSRRSSSVARDFNCRPRDAMVFWHSASLLAATASSFSCHVWEDIKTISKRIYLYIG